MRSKRAKKSNIRNLVVVSDTHCGDRLGLCPRDGAHLDDGGMYIPSRLQCVVAGWWAEFWGEWVPQATHGEPYSVVVNGDMIDGDHHGATHQISHNLEDQCEVAYRMFQPVVELCEGRFYVVRGTEAHVGKGGVEEERLAKRLGAIPNREGQYARWELRIRVGESLCQILHHIGTTGSSAHETSALNAEIAAVLTDAARFHREVPRMIARGHRHRCCEVRLPTKFGYLTCFVTAGWQMKTPFAYKVAGARVTAPQIGGSLIRQGDMEIHTRHQVWDIEPTPVEGDDA